MPAGWGSRNEPPRPWESLGFARRVADLGEPSTIKYSKGRFVRVGTDSSGLRARGRVVGGGWLSWGLSRRDPGAGAMCAEAPRAGEETIPQHRVRVRVASRQCGCARSPAERPADQAARKSAATAVTLAAEEGKAEAMGRRGGEKAACPLSARRARTSPSVLRTLEVGVMSPLPRVYE